MKGTVILEGKIRRGMVTLGYSDVSISDLNERSLWNVEGQVIFKGTAVLGAGTKIAVGKEARLQFGHHFQITAKSEIACFKEIMFGDECLISWNVLVIDTDAHAICNEKQEQINQDSSIIIGNKVWIGCRSLILKGSEISNECIIGAQSVINKKYNKSNCILTGQPAKIIKTGIKWK